MRDVVRQEFQSYQAAKPRVLRLVDHTHSATTELFDNVVVRNSRAAEGFGTGHVPHILGCGLGQVNETDIWFTQYAPFALGLFNDDGPILDPWPRLRTVTSVSAANFLFGFAWC